MGKTFRVLTINPGSTSTKIAVFDNETKVTEQTLRHSNEELAPFKNITEQFDFRKNIILDCLKENNIATESFDAVVGRGGNFKASCQRHIRGKSGDAGYIDRQKHSAARSEPGGDDCL